MTKFLAIAAIVVALGGAVLGVSKVVGLASSVNAELAGTKTTHPVKPQKKEGTGSHGLRPYEESRVLPKTAASPGALKLPAFFKKEQSRPVRKQLRRRSILDLFTSNGYTKLRKALKGLPPSRMAVNQRFTM